MKSIATKMNARWGWPLVLLALLVGCDSMSHLESDKDKVEYLFGELKQALVERNGHQYYRLFTKTAQKNLQHQLKRVQEQCQKDSQLARDLAEKWGLDMEEFLFWKGGDFLHYLLQKGATSESGLQFSPYPDFSKAKLLEFRIRQKRLVIQVRPGWVEEILLHKEGDKWKLHGKLHLTKPPSS